MISDCRLLSTLKCVTTKPIDCEQVIADTCILNLFSTLKTKLVVLGKGVISRQVKVEPITTLSLKSGK